MCLCVPAWGSRGIGGPDVRALIQYFLVHTNSKCVQVKASGARVRERVGETPETYSGSWSRALRRLAGGGL